MPDLRRILISLGALDVSGYTTRLEQGMLKVLKRSFVVMKGLR